MMNGPLYKIGNDRNTIGHTQENNLFIYYVNSDASVHKRDNMINIECAKR